MRPRIKVCCIQTEEEADLAIRHGASCIGLVAEMPSGPGPIPDEAIRRIARATPPGVASFLLTSRTTADALVDHVRFCETNVVQLVDEGVDLDAYRQLRSEVPWVKIVQVIHVEDGAALGRARSLQSEVDALLLDSGRPQAPTPELGGTGRTHDWEVSARIVRDVRVPVFLAGGLRAENVGDAVRVVKPYGVDLCSGVRIDGALDEERLVDFVSRVPAVEGGVNRVF
jgi:phosphoribosylanthranilate isomerase